MLDVVGLPRSWCPRPCSSAIRHMPPTCCRSKSTRSRLPPPDEYWIQTSARTWSSAAGQMNGLPSSGTTRPHARQSAAKASGVSRPWRSGVRSCQASAYRSAATKSRYWRTTTCCAPVSGGGVGDGLPTGAWARQEGTQATPRTKTSADSAWRSRAHLTITEQPSSIRSRVSSSDGVIAVEWEGQPGPSGRPRRHALAHRPPDPLHAR